VVVVILLVLDKYNNIIYDNNIYYTMMKILVYSFNFDNILPTSSTNTTTGTTISTNNNTNISITNDMQYDQLFNITIQPMVQPNSQPNVPENKTTISIDDSSSMLQKMLIHSNFVFDLRNINDTAPSELTGLDMELITYFLNNTDMMEYLSSVIKILNNVLQYIKSGYMIIGFGCASGRRKSIFASEYISRYINKTLQNTNYRDYTLIIKHFSITDWINKYDDKNKIRERKIYPV